MKTPRSDRYFDRFSFFCLVAWLGPLGLVSHPNNKVAQQAGHLYLLLSYELEQIQAVGRGRRHSGSAGFPFFQENRFAPNLPTGGQREVMIYRLQSVNNQQEEGTTVVKFSPV